MMFSGAENTFTARETVHLEKEKPSTIQVILEII